MNGGYTYAIEQNQAAEGCPPDWQEAGTARGYDERLAAEAWAYKHDNGDYTIVGGQTAHIRVRFDDDKPDAAWKEFKVEGRTERAYYAHEVETEVHRGGGES
jgi:hypothetical protein